MKKCDTTAFNRLKPNYNNTILWFCVGGVYQSFAEDAIKTAEVLNLHLHDAEDAENKTVKICVFPVYALDAYLQRMVNAHCKIGVCQQLETPPRKGIQPTLF